MVKLISKYEHFNCLMTSSVNAIFLTELSIISLITFVDPTQNESADPAH